MSLMRWFRKNNKKVMAIVVVIIMVGFIGGEYIRQLGKRRAGPDEVVAYIGVDTKITNRDLQTAGMELELLRLVGANEILSNVRLPLYNVPNFQPLLLGQLLFADRNSSPGIIEAAKRIAAANRYAISSKQIYDIYRTTVPTHLYWLLLKTEAEQAGVRVPNDAAGRLLAGAIPKLFNGASYSQLIGALVKHRGISEERILTAFAKLMAVIQYASMACSAENITAEQVKQAVSFEGETIDVEYVEFGSAAFAEDQPRPTQEQITAHFERYKSFAADAISDENPYGFGYKLKDLLRLEYIAVKLDDVRGIVKPPTQQETEEYYKKNRTNFIEQLPSEPNDPNSPLEQRIKNYSEVALSIADKLWQQKINSTAEMILQRGRSVTEAGFENLRTEPAAFSVEQLKQSAGDYNSAAEKLSKDYEIAVYSGQTGLLDVNDVQADSYLGRLFLQSSDLRPIWLFNALFAAEPLGGSELGPFDVPKPRIYENIGPAKDILGKIMLLTRIIEIRKASEPESLEQTINKRRLVFDSPQEKPDEIYSVKEKIVEDLKNLAAMTKARAEAGKFVIQVAELGWDDAIEKLNDDYKQQHALEPDEPNIFKLQTAEKLKRISPSELNAIEARSLGNPQAQLHLATFRKNACFADMLYNLVPADANSLENVPVVVEFKPQMGCYCLKKLLINRFTQDDFEKVKASALYQQDIIASQSIAAVHLNPENILDRMNFRAVRQQKNLTDTDEP